MDYKKKGQRDLGNVLERRTQRNARTNRKTSRSAQISWRKWEFHFSFLWSPTRPDHKNVSLASLKCTVGNKACVSCLRGGWLWVKGQHSGWTSSSSCLSLLVSCCHYYFIFLNGMSKVASGQWTQLTTRRLDRKHQVELMKLWMSHFEFAMEQKLQVHQSLEKKKKQPRA